jgi:DNA (cytosine-5)-methyltransferase 1
MGKLNYIDLFAGAGGLSEGFVREGFEPVAHVEMNSEACDTLRTRLVFHELNSKKDKKAVSEYYNYLEGKISRAELWKNVSQSKLESVINSEISDASIKNIFRNIDERLDGQKVFITVGGPPCQAYSLVGRSRDPNRMRGDTRNFLFRYYGEFLRRYKPEFFVFENVLGLLTAGNKRYLNEMLSLFDELGYSADYQVLNAEEYGVLQKRRRVIIIGHRGKTKFKFPELTTISNDWKVKKDLFSDLPRLKPGQVMEKAFYTTEECNDYLRKTDTRNGIAFTTQHITRPHNERDLEIYEIAIDRWLNDRVRLKYNDLPKRLQTHQNTEAFLDRYKVVDPDGYSHTVVAHIAKDGHYYIYPDKRQVRSISVREAARLQSFPDNYFFEGGRTAAFKQIGNAVPPLMAQAIAKKIKSM